MKNKLKVMMLLAVLLTSCNSQKEKEHVHLYAENDIEWIWTPNSVGYDVTATAVCLKCNESETQDAYVELISYTSSCTEEGERVYKATAIFGECEFFDSKTDIIPPLSHNPSSEWYSDEDEHYHICERCQEHIDVQAHSFTNWETVKEASYGVKGKKTRNCTICNYVAEEEIAALIPSISLVQSKIDKVINGAFPYSYQFVEEALYLYDCLPEIDQSSINKYNDVLTVKENYESSYDVISSVQDRTIRKQDADGLGYAGTWDGNVSVKTDDTHGIVNVLDIQTVGTGWGEQHFNGISFVETEVSVEQYKEIKFAIYNPNSVTSDVLLFSNGWYFVQKTSAHQMQPGWNDFSFTVKDGAYNADLGYHDFDLVEFSIVLVNNQVKDGWMISNFYGKKSSQSEINNVIALIDALPDSNNVTESNREDVENARKAYDALTEYAQSLVTNAEKLFAVENALNALAYNEVIELIDALPSEIETDFFKTFAKLDAVEVKYNTLSQSAKSNVTNYNKYETLKTKFDAKYKVIYNPRTWNGVAVEGASHATYTASNYIDNDYGPVLKVDASVNKGYSQFYGYNFPTETFASGDKINFKIYSSFEAIANTSQTFWAGDYGTATKFNLNAAGWTTITGTGSSFNSNGAYATSLNATSVSFINIQRWAEDSVLPNPYSGYYYISAIIVELSK